MGLFEDLSRFLETRLEEFLKSNPHLELQALEEQLQDQETETAQLMADLKLRQQRSQADILAIAQEIQRWHARVEKATTAGRPDLAQQAQQREAALLREGNQTWGQMEMLRERIRQTEELQRKIKVRRQEVKAKAAQLEAARWQAQAQHQWETAGWNQGGSAHSSDRPDPLEEQFSRWEAEDELEQMKRNLGR
jgi:uncharacterized protein (TIGR04376 family)